MNNNDDFNIDETTYEDDGVQLDEDYSFEDDEYTEEETGEYQTDSPFTPENIKPSIQVSSSSDSIIATSLGVSST